MDQRTKANTTYLTPMDAAASSIKESIAAVLRWSKLATDENDDAIENVHQLRIAVRRATAALELYSDFLPAGCNRKLLDQLKTLRKLAGPIRDSDVLSDRVSPEMFGIAVYSLSAHLSDRRKAARRELAKQYEKWGSGERLERLTTEALCAIRPRRKQRKRGEETFASFARNRLRKARRDFADAMRAKLKRPRRMHAFRVQVKSIRYLLEHLRPAFAAEQYDQVERLIKKVSQRLGDINDQAMAEAMLHQWRNEFPQPAMAKLLERASAHERKAMCQARDEFSNWWSRDRQRRLRRQLKKLSATTREPAAVISQPIPPRIRPAK